MLTKFKLNNKSLLVIFHSSSICKSSNYCVFLGGEILNIVSGVTMLLSQFTRCAVNVVYTNLTSAVHYYHDLY